MEYFIDVAFDKLNKHGEELCGDKVELKYTKDSVILVMADGLGSGVKANILATLTSKIAATMLENGASIYETIDTVVNTLPVCNIRKLAYCTFTIIQVHQDGRAYIAEYDNPPMFLIRGGKSIEVEKKHSTINGRVVKEGNFLMQEGDVLTVVSDGVVHAGVGGILNLGWQWDNILDYLKGLSLREKCAKNISKSLVEVCENLYLGEPGDDTTVVSIKFRKPEVVNLFTGPPLNREDDEWVVKELMRGRGKKVVCGGTAANIVARETNREILVSLDYIDKSIPPTANIRGIDLVTEGVLTLSKAVEIIRNYIGAPLKDDVQSLKGKDGASRLARLLIEDCTNLNLLIGRAVNPAHQNPDLPIDLSIKLKVVDELATHMEYLGKNVMKTYI
ncbi:Stage II sporulation protein E (SpoIIE) [Natronincola peptidivorans]|uniref:Stage II sporulation protein E (SpoIIE) n=1 Tax=Natronincola peptidivorans TaxID=426128 RepID=A0A1I0C7D8_9FIRM|nr:SpoIIE family protein phosphatase [Natronincola peptidivorans]SET15370.1 Stage II sporulation protein E (SpoIIE) [Natronincola peptidivorans]